MEKAGKPDNRQLPNQTAAAQHPNAISNEVVPKDVIRNKLTSQHPHSHPSLVDEDDSEMAFNDILTGDLLDDGFMMDNIIEGDDMKVEEGLVDFRNAEDSSDFSLDHTSQDVVNPKDEFNDILTSQFGLENIDPGLPSMDSKDVEDIFKGVLIEESQDNMFSQVGNVPVSSDVAVAAAGARVNSSAPMPPSSITTVASPSSGIPANIVTTGPGKGHVMCLKLNYLSVLRYY